jgi:hypothetical protein
VARTPGSGTFVEQQGIRIAGGGMKKKMQCCRRKTGNFPAGKSVRGIESGNKSWQ